MAVTLLTLVLATVFGLTAPALAAPGDLLVVDSSVAADSSGGVLAVNPLTGAARTLSSNASSSAAGGQAHFEDPFGVALEADGTILVADQAGFLGNRGKVVRVNPSTGAQTVLSSGVPLMDPTNIAIGPSGKIYVSDENALPDANGDGAIFEVDPTTGAVTTISTNTISKATGGGTGRGLFFDPLGIAVVPATGTILVVDDESGDSNVAGDNVGGIVAVDPVTGAHTLVSSNSISVAAGGCARFNDPRELALAPNGDIYVSDDRALAHLPGDLSLIRINPATGAQTLVSTNAISQAAGGGQFLARPYGVAIAVDGHVLVADSNGPGPYGAGGIISVDPATGAQTLVSSNARSASAGGEEAFNDPIDLLIAPGTATGTPETPATGGTGGGDPAGTSGDAPAADPARVMGTPRKLTLDATGRLRYAFRAAPAGAAGSVSFATASRVKVGSKRRMLTLGTKRFTVPSTGRVSVSVRVRGWRLDALRRLGSAKIRATIRIGSRTFPRTFSLKAPRKGGGR